MGKTQRRPENHGVAVSGMGVPLSKNARTFLKKCSDGFRDVLRVPFVDADSAPSTRGVLYYFRSAPFETTQDGASLPVFAVQDTQERFWLAISVRFSADERLIEHAGIHIYTGRRGYLKTLRIRAEWDLWLGASAAHAQPHWHVHSVDDMSAAGVGDDDGDRPVLEAFLADATEAAEPSLDDILSERAATSPGRVDSEDVADQWRLHLAMASGWHQEPDAGCIVTEINEAGVCRWLWGVTQYAIGQLRFAASRSPSATR